MALGESDGRLFPGVPHLRAGGRHEDLGGTEERRVDAAPAQGRGRQAAQDFRPRRLTQAGPPRRYMRTRVRDDSMRVAYYPLTSDHDPAEASWPPGDETGCAGWIGFPQIR